MPLEAHGEDAVVPTLCSVSEFKARLSHYADRAHEGEIFVITRHGVPIARVVPASEQTIDLFGALADRMPPLPDHIGPGPDPDILRLFGMDAEESSAA
jgi:prevent-host-death family protein